MTANTSYTVRKCDLNSVKEKEITRKKFSIQRYYENKENFPGRHEMDEPYIKEKNNCLCVDGNLVKGDAIAIAKYFKLTMDDLN